MSEKQDEHVVATHRYLQSDLRNPWPVVLMSTFGFGGDWSETPLGKILDSNRMRDSGFNAKCLKYNCDCTMSHV